MISHIVEGRGRTFASQGPWRGRRDFQAALERLGQALGSDAWRPYSVVSRQRWTPAIDVRRRENALLISADLPGLTNDDIEVTVTNNTLTLKGEKSQEPAGAEDCFCNERPYGRFTRFMALPPGVDPSRAEASFRRGVLEIKIPLREAPRPAPPKIVLHACLACRGDLFLDEGDEFVCLQCARRTTLRALEEARDHQAEGATALPQGVPLHRQSTLKAS